MKKSNPRIILHLEGLAIFILAIAIYFLVLRSNPLLFIILFLAPDLTFFGYLINKKIGSYLYNLFHNYVLPVSLLVISFYLTNNLGIEISMIWIAHIGIDRFVGYGLKYTDNFKNTHLHKV